jgi:hypothetical protein
VQNGEQVIARIRAFLKATYAPEDQLPSPKKQRLRFEASLFKDEDEDEDRRIEDVSDTVGLPSKAPNGQASEPFLDVTSVLLLG